MYSQTLPLSIKAADTLGIFVLNKAALTAIETASYRLPPHSKIFFNKIKI